MFKNKKEHSNSRSSESKSNASIKKIHLQGRNKSCQPLIIYKVKYLPNSCNLERAGLDEGNIAKSATGSGCTVHLHTVLIIS